MGRRIFLRVVVVVALVAVGLIPSLSAPARTISIPETLSRSLVLDNLNSRRVVFSFAATHLALSWLGPEETHVAYRTSGPEGMWSRWQRAPELDDHTGKRHFTGVASVYGATRAEWKPVGKHSERVHGVILDYLNTIDGPRTLVEIPQVANAAARTPDVVTRAEWGAKESLKRTSGGCERRFFPVRQVFVHHTAGSNYDQHPEATMRAIYWYHVVRQGWCDVGYNFVIAPDGRIFEGRWARKFQSWEVHDSENHKDRVVAGAHVADFNSGSVGVSLMGNFTSVGVPPNARRSLVELIAWEADRHDFDPRKSHVYRNPESGRTRKLPWVAGHRDAGTTACPGRRLYRDLPSIRRDATLVKGAGKTTTGITLDRPVPSQYGERATVSGVLRDENGTALIARAVASYVRPKGGKWRSGPESVTDSKGRFVLEPELARNAKVIVVYEGDETTWGSQSRFADVSVAPVMTLEPEGSTSVGSIHHYPSGTESIDFSGTIDPPHSGHAIKLRVSQRESDGTYATVTAATVTVGKGGVFTYRWAVPDDAAGQMYEALAVFRGDRDHAPGTSEPVYLTIAPG
jgi:hypothetical protein